MGLCFVPDCNHRYKSGCKMFSFPNESVLKGKWLKLIRRADATPNKFSLVCSCHFVDRNKENLPTLFQRNVNTVFTSPTAVVRKRPKMSSKENENPASHKSTIEINRPSTSSILTEAENLHLKDVVYTLQKKLEAVSFSYDTLLNNDSLILLYTGFPSGEIFDVVFNYLNKVKINYFNGWTVDKISKRDQILMTLMKLRLNLLHEDLAIRFNCSAATVTNIIYTWVNVMHCALFEKLVKNNIPSRTKNKTCLPSVFANFTNCRMIIDCTEIQTAIPHQLNKQKQTYSNYKHRNTLKGLIGVAPNGTITFISELYVGSTSDKKIVHNCGILSIVEAGDLLLADKGFLIQDILPPGVSLNIPPFLTNAQFTPLEVRQTTAIAKARIHVERAIRRIKIFQILNCIPASLRPYASKIFQVCGTLSNFNYPLIKEVEDLYD